uniref:Uncharacterized protein n=1 Tax=Anguilla anguilla TaxID=7936 RepID=A0A0E9TRF7_ANGAN
METVCLNSMYDCVTTFLTPLLVLP